MVNSQVTAEIIDALKLDVNVDKVPSPVPVVEVGLKSVKNGFCIGAVRTTTGSLAISAASLQSEQKPIYITQCVVSINKDATCDISTGAIYVIVQSADTGQTMNLAAIPVVTLQSNTFNGTYTFAHPIKILPNTNISLSGAFTAGSLVRTLTVMYYLDDVN